MLEKHYQTTVDLVVLFGITSSGRCGLVIQGFDGGKVLGLKPEECFEKGTAI
jgi:hypothetical protein